jgi:hypothetical protein
VLDVSAMDVLDGCRNRYLTDGEMHRVSAEHDLQRVCPRRVGEGVVGLDHLVELEAVRRERGRIEPTLCDQAQELRGRERVDETRRDRDVANPEPLNARRGVVPGEIRPEVGQKLVSCESLPKSSQYRAAAQ